MKDNESYADDAAISEVVGGQHGTGQTHDPRKAAEEGLSYTPPRDPPVIPSDDDRWGIEIAAGFASSMEDTDPDAQILPDRINGSNLEIEEDIGLALRYNSETTHLTDVSAMVDRGVVSLYGTVTDRNDIARVDRIVSGLSGVVKVINHLEVAG